MMDLFLKLPIEIPDSMFMAYLTHILENVFFFFLQEDIFPYLKIAEVLMDIWAKTCLLLKQERLQCFAFSHNQLSQF